MIWGKKKRAIYKLDPPYIEYISNYNLEDFSYNQLDQMNMDLMDSYIKDFLLGPLNIQNKLREFKNTNHSEITVMSQLMTVNKAYLIEEKGYINFFKSLQDIDPEDRDTSLIIGFYTDIVSSINNETLTKYINNLYLSLETISKDIEGTKSTWQDIHTTYPFFWLFLRISHLLLRSKF